MSKKLTLRFRLFKFSLSDRHKVDGIFLIDHDQKTSVPFPSLASVSIRVGKHESQSSSPRPLLELLTPQRQGSMGEDY